MQSYNVDFLIIGAGVTGLAFAGRLKSNSIMIVEKDREIGGYCKTFKQNGYVWDYAGHFFHFSQPEIKKQFEQVLNREDMVYSKKNTKIYYNEGYIDYPFQYNIHQLQKAEFIDCLYGLFTRSKEEGTSGFKAMLYSKFGAGISNKFLIPYNEKLYACDLNNLDENAMGRFFPNADPVEIVRSFKENSIGTYNDEFFYSSNGAETFVTELARNINKDKIFTLQEVSNIDYQNKIAYTDNMEIHYSKLVNTMPFVRLIDIMRIKYQEKYTANKVLVFNLGFDKAPLDREVHWIYYPSKEIVFYRVGFYNNILRQEKMSLYVEIGLRGDQKICVDKYKDQVIQDLQRVGIISDHHLMKYNVVVMDPAYVHISEKSQKEKELIKKKMAKYDIYTIGRYGNWTYCSIEDCIKEAYMLAERLEQVTPYF